MEFGEHDRLKDSIFDLAGSKGDTLRASQRIMAALASTKDQEGAFQAVVHIFANLTPPQRLIVLGTIHEQLTAGQLGCLALVQNRTIVEHVLDQIGNELTRKKGLLGKLGMQNYVYGPIDQLMPVVTLTTRVRDSVSKVSIPEREFSMSPRLGLFLRGLADYEFGRLISFVGQMRDIKACRDPYWESVNERYIGEKLGEINAGPFHEILKDDLKFLRDADRVLVHEMTQMDFYELTVLLEELMRLRTEKYQQGSVREV